jgi:hypothetical protein
MRGGNRSALRWLMVLAVGLAGALLVACIIPFLSSSTPTPIPTPTPPLLASPTPTQAPTPAGGTPVAAPGAKETRITEQELNRWLEGAQTHLGEGIDLSDSSVAIHSTGITVTGRVQVAQLQGAQIPVQIVLRPVVHDERVSLEVLDVQLGGAYSSFSGLVKPLISQGLAQGADANALLAESGMHISALELHEGYMVATTVPAGR